MGFWGFGEQYVTERRSQKTVALRIAPQNPKTPYISINEL
jgi:hypothetical protein